jgi:hypothetical protein
MAIAPVEDDPKNMAIAVKPGMRTAAGRSRPTANEKNRNTGNRTPNIRFPGRR